MGGGGGGGESTESSVVPRASLDAVGDTLAAVNELQSHLRQALALADPDVLAELPPLHRGRAFLVLARAASTLVEGGPVSLSSFQFSAFVSS